MNSPHDIMIGDLQLVECPRDAMQGWATYIPTEQKVAYISMLMRVGFHTLDFGSFVSPKAIPQMRDTHDVVKMIERIEKRSRLLAIVANARGARDASSYDIIDDLGYPFSISETFQRRNTNATIEESLVRVDELQRIADHAGKHVVLYLSMGFGNPYGDDWNVDIVARWVERLVSMGFDTLMLSDTIGVADAANIQYLFSQLIPAFSDTTIGAHLHTAPHNWREKVHAAYQSGCRRFDGAIKGYGGCPMAQDDLIGNMPMERLIYYLDEINVLPELDHQAFGHALTMADELFLHD